MTHVITFLIGVSMIILGILHGHRMYRLGLSHGASRQRMADRHQAERDRDAREFAMAKIRLTILQGQRMAMMGEDEP